MLALTIVAAALAVVQQAATADPRPDPFFSDDLEGWLKLAALYGSGVGALALIMVRLAYNAHTTQLKTNTDALNGLGARLDTEIAARTEASAAVGLLVTRVTVLDDTVQRHERELGETDARLSAYEKAHHQLQNDIMAAIRESGAATQRELHALNIKIARFEEREKFGEAMGEIAQALRLLSQK